MNENIRQQPERAVNEFNSDKQPEEVITSLDSELQEFVFDVYKRTGIRITKDDPVLGMVLLHNAIQKKQVKILNENFVALTEGFRQVLISLEEKNLQRFRNIVDTCGDLDTEIEEAVNKGKKSLESSTNDIQSELVRNTLNLFSGIKKDFERVTEGYQKQIDTLSKSAKPFSTAKAVAICVACTLFVTAGLSGAFWYVAQQQKESSLRFYANGYVDMRTLTEKTISKLPKTQQEQAKAELIKLENRQPD